MTEAEKIKLVMKLKRRKELLGSIIFIMLLVSILIFIIYGTSNNISNKYKPDPNLYVKYDLATQLIPAPKQQMIPKEKFTTKVRGVTLTVTKLATYDITGKVEAIKDYNTNPIANSLSFKGDNVYDYISPIDLTLSWGQVAKKENSGHIYCDQYAWNTYRAVQISYDSYLVNKYGAEEVYSQVSNNHLISLNKDIRKLFSKVKLDDIVRIVGHLVYVEDSYGGNWGPSSTSRTDGGNFDGCEIIWVDDFVIMPK